MRVLSFLLGTVAVVFLGLLLARFFLRMAIGDKITDPTPQELAEIAAAAAPQVLPTSGAPPPATPLALRLPSETWRSSAQWALGSAFGALCLFGDPSLLWTRWLAYPAAIALLLVALISTWGAWSEWHQRLVVTAVGLERREGSAVAASLRWSDVATVVLMEQWASRLKGGSSIGNGRYLVSRKLIFADAQGRTLLELPEPLRPAQVYRQFLDAIPAWTGVRVVRQRKTG